MSDGQGWRYRDATGAERELNTAQLRGALASGALPVDTQVYRAALDGWVRAGDVPELFPRTLTPPPPMSGNDLPEPPAFLQAVQHAYERSGVGVDMGDARPALPTIPGHAPPPDIARSPIISLAPLTMASPTATTPVKSPIHLTPSKPTLVGVPVSALAPPPPESAAEIAEPVAPNAVELPHPQTAPTRPLRPLHAVQQAVAISEGESTDAPGGMVTPRIVGVPGEEPIPDEPPTKPRVQGPHGTLAMKTLTPIRSEDDAPLTLPAGHKAPTPIEPPEPYPHVPTTGPKMMPIVLGVVGVVALIGIIGAARAIFRTKPSDQPTTTAAATPTATTTASAAPASSGSAATAPVATPPKAPDGVAPNACKLGKTPVKIGTRVSKDVPVELAAWAAQSRVVVGYSSDGRTAAGVSFDTATLASRRERLPRAFGKLRRAAPIATDKTLRWALDVDVAAKKPPPVQRLETVLANPMFQVGIADGGLVSLDKPTDTPKKLFAIPGGTLDAMRSLPIAGEGAAIVLRAADTLYFAMLGQDHTPSGELAKLSEPGQVGVPSIAASASELAVVFAWRAVSTDPWSLRWTHGPRSAALPASTAIAIPPGGPGGDVFAPSIAALADGRWLLTWTEGSTGARAIRVLTLGADGTPSTEAPLSLSPAGSNAGQASILPLTGGSVSAVYLTATRLKNVFDLWATTVECP